MDEKQSVAQAIVGSDIRREHDFAWNDCGIEEKVERLRREIQNLRYMMKDVRRRTRTFEEHEHNAKGEVVAPIRSKYSEGEASMWDMLA